MWSTNKPTEPGIYQVRNYDISKPDRVQTVVVVEHVGQLRVSLHDHSDSNPADFYPVAELNAAMEWQGPYELVDELYNETVEQLNTTHDVIEDLLREILRIYETGRDKLYNLGEIVDDVDTMFRHNPALREARALVNFQH